MMVNRIALASWFVVATLSIAGCSYSWDSNSQSKSKSTSFGWSINANSSGTTSSSSTNETTTINGVSKRTSIRKYNGVEQRLETSGNVKFLQGRPVKWSPESLIRQSEKQSGTEKFAEFRPSGQHLKLFVKRDGKYQPSTSDDEQWAARILGLFNLDDTPESEKKQQLVEKCQKKTLSSQEQIALIDDIFGKISYSSDQRELLLSLIERRDFTREAKLHLIDKLDQMHYESDRKRIEQALLK